MNSHFRTQVTNSENKEISKALNCQWFTNSGEVLDYIMKMQAIGALGLRATYF